MSEKPTRVLPIYLLVECSAAMKGELIQQVMYFLDAMKEELMKDPKWASFLLSAITFHTTAQQEIPLTAIMDFVPPRLTANGNSALGAALRVLMDCIKKELRPRDPAKNIRGDYKPIILLIAANEPTDDWRSALDELRKFHLRPVLFWAFGFGLANKTFLKEITEDVQDAAVMESGDITRFLHIWSLLGEPDLDIPTWK